VIADARPACTLDLVDVESLLAGFLISSVGFVLMSYGRKMGRAPQLGVGLFMLVVPLLSPSALATLALGGALLLALWIALRMGL
jgi:hypothetical protein